MITFGNYNNLEKTLEHIVNGLTNELKQQDKNYSTEYNVYKSDGFKHYEFMLPGFEKDEIRVEINHKNEISIVAKKTKKEAREYIERNVQDTKRFKIQIYSELINDDVKTTFEDGILTLSFKPKNNPKILKIN